MTSETVAFDERVAARYEAWYETPEGRRADELEKAVLGWLLRAFPGSDSVLEIGCGTGHFTRWLSDEGLAAVGLDLSLAMLAEARALGGVPLVQGDARRLPFADGAFDLTAFITTLEFLEHPQEALAEALRVARDGFLLGVLNRWSLLGLQRRLEGLFRPTVYDAAHFYGVGELKRLLRSVAGRKVRVVWHTTLFSRGWPWSQARLPWGGFVGMVLVVSDGFWEVR
ncbi:MAG: class I SAM-dependent methyltransferase [Chloroflexota bacterium]|nr:class I SAM-dependent methyltransferase [Chloroflexota bacterium]